MSKPIPYVAVLLFSLTLFAAPPKKSPTPVDPELRTLEDVFNTTADKADRDADRIKSQASERRLEGYRNALKTATKAGDFDKATRVKARIVELEAIPFGKRVARPQKTVLYKGHRYAFIPGAVTWHVARRKCEEMGGHLVCINNPEEEDLVVSLCSDQVAWVGATDEEVEGQWYNVDGSNAIFSRAVVDNSQGIEHWLVYDGKRFNDVASGGRTGFVCEWSN